MNSERREHKVEFSLDTASHDGTQGGPGTGATLNKIPTQPGDYGISCYDGEKQLMKARLQRKQTGKHFKRDKFTLANSETSKTLSSYATMAGNS